MNFIYPFIIAFLLIFVSELGDKTQLLVLSFSSKLIFSFTYSVAPRAARVNNVITPTKNNTIEILIVVVKLELKNFFVLTF